MLKTIQYKLRLLIVLTVLVFCQAVSAQNSFKKTADGVLVYLPKNTSGNTRLVRLRVISDRIIHVIATPKEVIPTEKSLVVPANETIPSKWNLVTGKGSLSLQTVSLNANISLITGAVNFTDKSGKTILKEDATGGKSFTPTTIDGGESCLVRQVFMSQADEAFYGLGQHQQGIMNYKNDNLELAQQNTEVVIPFMVSNKNYGILWENCSITKFGDGRDYEPLSTLKLYDTKGKAGSLTATYYSKKSDSILLQQPENALDYEYLNDMKKFPSTVLMQNSKIKWEGSMESDFTGRHKFSVKYAGYTKVWIDGVLVLDRWRQSWNPAVALVNIDMQQHKKYSIKIEWNPDGGESFLTCKWLSPRTENAKDKFAFCSEDGDKIDYYFMYGKNMDEVVSNYRNITGKAPIMPKWAMGLWQSRERYKTQEEVLSVVKEFRKKNIPLDNIVMDWQYWKPDEWGSQDFDTSRFPDAKGMIDELHNKYNTKFMVSVWPKFYTGNSNYDLFKKNGWLYTKNVENNQKDWLGYVSTFYDAFNVDARKGFWDLLNKHLYSKGVDAWWLDASEPDIHSNLSNDERKQLMQPNALGSSTKYFNAFPLVNAQAIYEGQRNTNPNKRVFILTRSGFAGMQRYASAVWSGDIAARWSDLKNQIPAGINFSMSGMPYWTMDIGGFAVENRFENAKGKDLVEWQEQMTRWYQFGAFCPLFRVHGQFPYREIYNVAKETDAAYQSMLYYDKLRYQLMPYIYSLASKTYFDNYTIMRGLPMDFPNDKKVTDIGDEYMFGPSLLVSPVYEFNARKRNVYLPAGNGWYNLYNSDYNAGGQNISADAPMERIPVFVKEGSILPLGPAMQYSDEKKADTLTLMVYTGKDASFTLYEDENVNYNYEKGAFANIVFKYTEANKTLTVEDRKGEFEGMLKKRFFNIVWVTQNKALQFDDSTKSGTLIEYSGKKTTIAVH